MGLLSWLFGSKPAEQEKPSPYPMPNESAPFRGWTNIGWYEVRGINSKTKRSNKKRCSALSGSDARRWALNAGLIEPISVMELERLRPSSYQIHALRKIGYNSGFEKMTNVDASALISYDDDGDRRRITQQEWNAACAAGFEISALSGPTLYQHIMETGDWHRYDEE